MIENNKWYKTGYGSLYFKTRDRGFSSGVNRVEGFGYSYSNNLWCRSKCLIPRSDWKEITSPIKVLEFIQRGMKSKGYNNNVLIKPFNLDIFPQSLKPIRLKDYYFDLKDSDNINLLLNYGELWLTNNPKIEDRYVCVLKGGKFSEIIK